jgi:multidrug efflux pump subunit AcrB
MLSSVFVDRPRLAIVIALVTTIAGLVSLLAIPISQYPDMKSVSGNDGSYSPLVSYSST